MAAQLGVNDGLIYLLGQYDLPAEDSDLPGPWKQRKYFYYCTGVDNPDCCVIYDIKMDVLVLYIPEIDPKSVAWNGRGPTIDEARNMYDVDQVFHNSQLFRHLDKWKKQRTNDIFYILHKDHIPDVDGLSPVDSDKLLPAIEQCRVLKDGHEISCIRKANDVSASAHRAVLRNLRSLESEKQIQAIFEYVLTTNQATPAYGTIAGSGENAATLHYMKNDEPLQGRQLVCLDAGAELDNYTSDVTRTFPISGYFSKEAEEIYGMVELMQESCIQALKPGVQMWDLQVHCHKVLIEGFLRLGLFHNGTLDEILEAGTSKGFLPHGLGHHVGLEVHDVLHVPTMRYSAAKISHQALVPERALAPCRPEHPPLKEGMVVTIEPGIYFNRYALEREYLTSPTHSKYINSQVLEKYWAVGGVRIEDDILITSEGYENLTTAPKGNDALELIRTGKDCRDWSLPA